MAFGIPGSTAAGGGEFLGRIQFDARTGFWTVVKRIQDMNGVWTDKQSDPMRTPQFLMDFGTLEVGFIKFASPPAFVLVPYGQTIPPQPEEMAPDAGGKQRKAFKPAFRVKLASPKTFGDGDAYYFAQNSQTVLDVMDDLHQRFETSPEAATGKIPVVSVTGTRTVEFKAPQGTTKFHAPLFEITSWLDRIPVFGDRTVPAPVPRKDNPAPVAPHPGASAAALNPGVAAQILAAPPPAQPAPGPTHPQSMAAPEEPPF